jgi:hypothetical protein
MMDVFASHRGLADPSLWPQIPRPLAFGRRVLPSREHLDAAGLGPVPYSLDLVTPSGTYRAVDTETLINNSGTVALCCDRRRRQLQ